MTTTASPELTATNETTKGSRLPSWFRSEDHLAIAALLLLFVGMVLVYSSVIPFFEGPDASAHFRYVTYLRQQRTLPAAGQRNHLEVPCPAAASKPGARARALME